MKTRYIMQLVFTKNYKRKSNVFVRIPRWLKRVIVFLCCLVACDIFAQKPILISFGWDYPDVAEMNNNLPSMQNTPFDGICFSLQRQIMEAFDTTLRQPGYFEQGKLKALKWGRYKSNFIILRGFAKTGGRWFDDDSWEKITGNMTNLSKALANPGVKGVLFDPEYYYEDQLYNPWTYSEKQYPRQSFAEVQAMVTKRGTQFIRALQKYKADFSFLSIWITSLIVEDRKFSKLEATRHALLLPFIEGILLGKKSTVKVIDGNEYAYWNNKPSQFLEIGDFLRTNLVGLMRSDKAKIEARKVSIAQPLFYDGLLALAPRFDKGYSTEAKWKWLQENTKFAMAASDGIVWFYSERLNNWKGPVNDTLYHILSAGKEAQANSNAPKNQTVMAELPRRANNINAGKGYYYVNEAKKPMETGDLAFTYTLNRSSKKFTIVFPDKIPQSLSVYTNNMLSKTLKPNGNKQVISLSKFKNGKLVVLAKYADNTEATSIDIYK